MIVQQSSKRSQRLAKLIKALHGRRGVSWRALGKEIGVSDASLGAWRDCESSPERKNLDAIGAHPLVGWTPQQLELYLDGKFDEQNIEDLLDNGIPEEVLPVATLKQALKKYSYADRVEILSYLADLLKPNISETDDNHTKSTQKKITEPAKVKGASSDNPNDGTEGEKEKMPIQLSRLADIRLRPLLRDSLLKLGFEKNLKGAAQWACEDAEDAEVLAPILKHLVNHRFEPRIGYPKHLLEALAGLCFQVDYWISDSQPVINPSKTYRGEVEQFLSDLEKPLNHCQSAK